MTKIKPIRFHQLATILFAVQFFSAAYSQGLEPSPAFSPDIHLNRSLGVVADEQVSFPASPGLFGLGALPSAADVDAVHGMDNGEVLFSLDTSIVLGGTLYRPSDIIRFNGSTWSKELDGKAEGIPDGVNVDAIAMTGDQPVSFSSTADTNSGTTSLFDLLGVEHASLRLKVSFPLQCKKSKLQYVRKPPF